MKVAFVCPACKATITAPPSLHGEAYPCPKCKADVDRWPASVSSPASVRVVPPPVEQAVWHYSANGARRGPVTTAQLRSLVESGMLRASDLIWREGLPAWVEAGTAPDLFPAAAIPPPVPMFSAPPPIGLPPQPVERDDHRPIRVNVQQVIERREEEEEDEEPRPRRRRPPPRTNPWLFRSALAAALVIAGGFVLFFVMAEARYQALGTRLMFNGGELYYTSAVTRAEAVQLGNHLIRSGFYNGDRKSAQLHREGRWYQFRMVIKKGVEHDPDYNGVIKLFLEELSREVFNGQPVEIHLCDERLKTIRTVLSPNVR